MATEKPNLINLPHEIHRMILSYFSDLGMTDRDFLEAAAGIPQRRWDYVLDFRKTLTYLCATCKAMQTVVEPSLYHTVAFSGDPYRMPPFYVSFMLVLDTLYRRPELGKHVRRFAILTPKDCWNYEITRPIPCLTRLLYSICDELEPANRGIYERGGSQLQTLLNTLVDPEDFISVGITSTSILAFREVTPNLKALALFGPLYVQFDEWNDLFIGDHYQSLTRLSMHVVQGMRDAIEGMMGLSNLQHLTLDTTMANPSDLMHEWQALRTSLLLRGRSLVQLVDLTVKTACMAVFSFLAPMCTQVKDLHIAFHGLQLDRQGFRIRCDMCSWTWSSLIETLRSCPGGFSTVETLTLDHCNDNVEPGDLDDVDFFWLAKVDSLRHFTALKHLRIHPSVWWFSHSVAPSMRPCNPVNTLGEVYSAEHRRAYSDFLQMLPASIRCVTLLLGKNDYPLTYSLTINEFHVWLFGKQLGDTDRLFWSPSIRQCGDYCGCPRVERGPIEAAA